MREATARAPRRGRWRTGLRRIAPWALAGIAVVLAALWIWTALTSNHSTPWYNDWLIILVLYAVFIALAAPRIVFARLRPSPAPESEGPRIVRTTAAYLVAFFGGIWILGFPMQYAAISPIATITEVDGDEVAIVSYNRVGPRGLLQMAFGMESQRVVAVDLTTGHHIWDTQISETAYDRPSVLGIEDGHVYVENSAGITSLSLADGSPDSGRPSDEITQAWTIDDADPSGSKSTAAHGDGFVAVESGVLSISDDDESWETIGAVGPDDLDIETTIVIDPIVHRHSTRTVYDDEYGQEEAQAVGGEYLVLQEEEYRSWGVYDHVLRSVDAASGRIIDEIAIPERVRGGMTAPTGTSIVVLEAPMMSTTDLIIVSPGGTMSRSTIGRTGFFSEAL